MLNQDDDLDIDETKPPAGHISRRKILFVLIPLLIAVGLFVGFYYAFNHSYNSSGNLNYSIVKNMVEQQDGKETEEITVFYDLPEISARLQNQAGLSEVLKMKLSIELSRVEDVSAVENLLPRINDAVISHTMELNASELEGSQGLYWLKQELLYRINLLTSPIRVTNLNFKSFEIQKAN